MCVIESFMWFTYKLQNVVHCCGYASKSNAIQNIFLNDNNSIVIYNFVKMFVDVVGGGAIKLKDGVK